MKGEEKRVREMAQLPTAPEEQYPSDRSTVYVGHLWYYA